jgi:TPP-dependent pyruvate/acetoin dehydrogenase alpha subunit
MGTALDRSESQTDLALKASSYGMPAWPVDGMDVIAVDAAARHAVESIRGGGGPHFLELRTYRFRAHSMYDPERYRDKAEVEQWKERDPLDSFVAAATAAGLVTTADVTDIERDVAAEIDAAIAFAEAGTTEPAEDLLRFVTSERSAS